MPKDEKKGSVDEVSPLFGFIPAPPGVDDPMEFSDPRIAIAPTASPSAAALARQLAEEAKTRADGTTAAVEQPPTDESRS